MRYRKKGFVQNTMIMFIAMFITKGLGAVLKIPLGNILGGEGMGYFTTAYSIYTPVLAFACSGIPTIITQITAQYEALGKEKELYYLRSGAVKLSIIVGLLGTALIYLTALPFTLYIANSPESLLSVFIIAPAVFSCSVTAVYRGYYEGLSDMLPTACSQVIEAVVKAVVGITLSYFVYINGEQLFGSSKAALPYAAAAAVLGVTISEFCGTFYIAAKSRHLNAFDKKRFGKAGIDNTYDIIKNIFRRSLPLALGAATANLISFTDMLTVSNCANMSRSLFPQAFSSVGALSDISAAGINDIGNFLYGSYSGMVLSVYMLVGALSGLIARCSLPKLVCAIEKNDRTNIDYCVGFMIKGSAFITIPASFMVTVLAEPVLNLLYPVRSLEVAVSILPLQILCLGGVIGDVCGVISVIFYAYGDFGTPVKISLYSGFVKFIFNVLLITIPQINIAGAALSTIAADIFASFYAVNKIKKMYGITINILKDYKSSLIAGSVSSASIIITYPIIAEGAGTVLGMIISSAICVIMYLFIHFLAAPKDLISIIESIFRKKSKKPCKTGINDVKCIR